MEKKLLVSLPKDYKISDLDYFKYAALTSKEVELSFLNIRTYWL